MIIPKNTGTPVARLFAIGVLLAGVSSALAAVHYVDVNSTNATPPYNNWLTAATDIQDAVGVALAGDEVVVTNGTYYAPVFVSRLLSVRSVNGPESTSIDGGNYDRCAYLTNGASLSGFTLTRGHAFDLGGGVSGDNGGYGGYGGTLNNCKLAFNFSGFAGGAAYLCTLNNCTLSGNQAYSSPGDDAFGGGAYDCMLNNCTLIGNSAGAVIDGYSFYGSGGGAYSCTLNNCILAYNSAHKFGGGAAYCTLNNCIVWHDTAPQGADVYGSSGFGYGTTDPGFVHGSRYPRLLPKSLCINAGNNSYVTSATDLDGNPRIAGGTVDIGAYEYQWPELTIAPSGPNVLLRWPTNSSGYDYTGFTLQSTTNLGSRVTWTTNSPAPVVIGGQNVIINPISGPQQFFRLRQ
jgi:hypothetical protein